MKKNIKYFNEIKKNKKPRITFKNFTHFANKSLKFCTLYPYILVKHICFEN